MPLGIITQLHRRSMSRCGATCGAAANEKSESESVRDRQRDTETESVPAVIEERVDMWRRRADEVASAGETALDSGSAAAAATVPSSRGREWFPSCHHLSESASYLSLDPALRVPPRSPLVRCHPSSLARRHKQHGSRRRSAPTQRVLPMCGGELVLRVRGCRPRSTQ